MLEIDEIKMFINNFNFLRQSRGAQIEEFCDYLINNPSSSDFIFLNQIAKFLNLDAVQELKNIKQTYSILEWEEIKITVSPDEIE